MPKGFSYPLDWVASAMGSVIGTLIFYFIAVALGIAAIEGELDPGYFMLAPWFILTSFGGGPVGLILLPVNIYVLWSLFTEKHNPYLLLSLTVCLTALIAYFHEDYGYSDLKFIAFIILTPPLYVLFTAWFMPVKKFLSHIGDLKR